MLMVHASTVLSPIHSLPFLLGPSALPVLILSVSTALQQSKAPALFARLTTSLTMESVKPCVLWPTVWTAAVALAATAASPTTTLPQATPVPAVPVTASTAASVAVSSAQPDITPKVAVPVFPAPNTALPASTLASV